jgi:hypothetical protein
MAYESLWLKRVLIPFWVVQMLVCLVYLAVSALGLGFWKARQDDIDDIYADYGYSTNDRNASYQAV